MTLAPKPFVRPQYPPKIRSVSSKAALRDFADSHFWCQCCGREPGGSIHHIIGGRGGRSDEACNLLMACLRPCHLEFADHSRNLGVVLSIKLRAGELGEADLARLTVLHGRRLPDLAEIPAYFTTQYDLNAMRRKAGVT